MKYPIHREKGAMSIRVPLLDFYEGTNQRKFARKSITLNDHKEEAMRFKLFAWQTKTGIAEWGAKKWEMVKDTGTATFFSGNYCVSVKLLRAKNRSDRFTVSVKTQKDTGYKTKTFNCSKFGHDVAAALAEFQALIWRCKVTANDLALPVKVARSMTHGYFDELFSDQFEIKETYDGRTLALLGGDKLDAN